MTHPPARNSTRRVLIASMAGTTIEFFDFYIYATAAVLMFPTLFFPSSDPTSATLQSLATFALAFFARPVGSAIFGHFGDRIGRKATLVASLMTMGVSTVLVGLLPTYATIGVADPQLLALCRLGQGLGFLLSSGSFLLLAHYLTEAQFFAWGWRLPCIASAVLVGIGLWVRLRIEETPEVRKTLDADARVRLPLAHVVTRHPRALITGTFAAVATFVLFYLMTVFTLSWGTSRLGYSREAFLVMLMIGVLFFALTIPLSALLAA